MKMQEPRQIVQLENPMRRIILDKVTLNITVGNDEPKLAKAFKLLELLSSSKPTKNLARKRIATWKIRKGLPIGCRVTLRGKKAANILRRLLDAVEFQLRRKQFRNNTVTFGVKEYIQIHDFPYQRDIGIMGLDVAVTLTRPGFRVAERKIKQGRLPARHKITREETLEFMEKNFNAKIE